MNTPFIDLDDVQGNIVKAYGRFGYPTARYIFFQFHDMDAGRGFIHSLLPLITTSRPWFFNTPLPPATTNIAFSYQGLKHLGLPTMTLHSFPEEFSMGMKARGEILGDDGPSSPEHWDPLWQNDKRMHMFMSINARDDAALEARYQEIQARLAVHGGKVEQLHGHRGIQGDDMPYQQAAAVVEDGKVTTKEHFGYTDGISDPYFKGSGSNPINLIGGGKPTRKDPTTAAGWAPLETGEFILGYRDETHELPIAPVPRLLSYNGTFMVYRKLHENVGSFNRYTKEMGKDFPGGPEALVAKMSGRWRNGAPVVSFPSQAEADAFINELEAARQTLKSAVTGPAKAQALAHYNALRKRLTGFNFNSDLSGGRCPMGSHIRRTNPRGCLEYGNAAYNTPGALDNRRRILRRGLPYGEVTDPTSDTGEHGIIFMAIGTSIERQFEFVQQQWINYGNDFKLANQKDPLIGNHDGQDTFMIEGSSGKNPPFFCARLPRFVTTRGGEYFFIPSLTAIRMIADNLIDPT
jgi:Dyp-type peroxidase family